MTSKRNIRDNDVEEPGLQPLRCKTVPSHTTTMEMVRQRKGKSKGTGSGDGLKAHCRQLTEKKRTKKNIKTMKCVEDHRKSQKKKHTYVDTRRRKRKMERTEGKENLSSSFLVTKPSCLARELK